MKPEDKFEAFVKDHREELDFDSPTPDLWSKIDTRLEQTSGGKVISLNWKKVIARAAAVLIISTLSIAGYEFFQNQGTKEVIAAKTEDASQEMYIPAEIREEIYYYNNKVNTTLTEFNQLTANTPSINDEVQKDLKELDEDMQVLLRDLQEGVDSEEVVDAMIQNYRYRLQVLEVIMKKLKEEKYGDEEQNVEI